MDMDEVSFDSLPFLFSDSERSIILQYKQKAVQKEHELDCRRRERLEQLRSLVQQRLTNAEARKQLRCSTRTLSAREEDAYDACREQQARQCGWQTSGKEVSLQCDTPTGFFDQSPSSLSSHVTMKKEQNVYTLVSAVAKGFLVRHLLCSVKVKEIVRTIKDASTVLKSIEKSGDQQDCALHSRVRTQVAKVKLHNIFFTIPVAQRMMYIAHDRHLRKEPRVKQSKPSAGRISSATVKALNRKKSRTTTVH